MDDIKQDKHVFDANQLIAFSATTLQKLFKAGNDCVVLYAKYFYHAKIQRTNRVYTTDLFMARGLGRGWSERQVQRVKAKLKEIGMIEVIKMVDPDTGKIDKWFIKLNHMVTRATVAKLKVKEDNQSATSGEVETTSPNAHIAICPHCHRWHTKCFKDKNLKCLTKDNKNKSLKDTYNLSKKESVSSKEDLTKGNANVEKKAKYAPAAQTTSNYINFDTLEDVENFELTEAGINSAYQALMKGEEKLGTGNEYNRDDIIAMHETFKFVCVGRKRMTAEKYLAGMIAYYKRRPNWIE